MPMPALSTIMSSVKKAAAPFGSAASMRYSRAWPAMSAFIPALSSFAASVTMLDANSRTRWSSSVFALIK